jgi:hypothetical protein
MKAEEADHHTGKRISATMLTGGCKRQTLLKRSIPFYVEPKRALPAYRGRLIHLIAEEAKDIMEQFGWQIEFPLELPCTTMSGEWILCGTLDAWAGPDETLYDIKSLQEYAVKLMVSGKNNGIWSNHIPDYYIVQLNIYRYMAKMLGLFEAKRLRLQVVSFGDLILTGTSPAVRLQKGYKSSVDTYDIPDVPILSDSVIEEIIEVEGDHWYRILFEGEKAPIRDPDWEWLCKFCYFNGTQWCPDPDKEEMEHQNEK